MSSRPAPPPSARPPAAADSGLEDLYDLSGALPPRQAEAGAPARLAASGAKPGKELPPGAPPPSGAPEAAQPASARAPPLAAGPPAKPPTRYELMRAEILANARMKASGAPPADAKLRGGAAAGKSAAGGDSAAARAKRGPGRPPRRPPPPPLEKKGIVDSPNDADNKMEFAYEEPQVFKSLFTYFKNVKAKEVHVRCAPGGLTFFTRDHEKQSRIVAHVDGRHANWYYCDEEFWLGLNRETIEKMFSSIDKSFSKISIVHRQDDSETLTFILKDLDIEKEANYKFKVSALDDDEELVEAEDELTPEAMAENFPIEFLLTDKQFKKSVNDIAAYSDTVTIERHGRLPLQFTYAKVGLTYNEVYRSDEKIRLRSEIADGHSFRCTVKVANIKSLAASMVTEDVRLLLREDGDILFRSAIDAKALVVSTLVRTT